MKSVEKRALLKKKEKKLHVLLAVTSVTAKTGFHYFDGEAYVPYRHQIQANKAMQGRLLLSNSVA